MCMWASRVAPRGLWSSPQPGGQSQRVDKMPNSSHSMLRGLERHAPHKAVHFVALAQQMLRQVAAVLPGNSRNEYFLFHRLSRETSVVLHVDSSLRRRDVLKLFLLLNKYSPRRDTGVEVGNPLHWHTTHHLEKQDTVQPIKADSVSTVRSYCD
jgi:hypothetical protein